MNHLDFIKNINKTAPTKQDFLELGISVDSAEENTLSYFLGRKKLPFEILAGHQSYEIVKLISEYDLSLFNIGLVSFATTVKEMRSHIYIGNVELDILAINTTTNEIEVLDHDSPSYTIWLCASNDQTFLDAIFEFAKYLFFKVKNGIYFDDAGELLCANRCIEIAGGQKYAAFYQMLIQS